MIIERVEVYNFGPFKGKHEIQFPAGGAGVHLIRGDNGQGKTSLQRAILWGLYGKVVDRKGETIRPSSLLNHAAQKQDLYQFYVKIQFNHDGKTWVFTRKAEGKTHTDASYEKGTRLLVSADGEPQPNEEHIISRIMPEQVNRFFFFDGEMLRDYEELLDQSRPAMARLRDSIERVLGIPYLKTARDDVVEVQKRLDGERGRLLRKLGGRDFDRVADDLENVNRVIDERRGQIQALEKQMTELDNEMADLKRKHSELRAVSEASRERLQLERKISDLEGKRDKEMASQSAIVAQLYKTILVNSAAPAIARLEQRHESTMGKYKEKLYHMGRADELRKAIASQKCRLCGHTIEPEKLKGLELDLRDAEHKVQELTEVPEPNTEFEHHLNRLRRAKRQLVDPTGLQESEDRIHQLNHEISQETAKLERVKEQLRNVDEDEPRKLELKIQGMAEERGRLKGRKETQEQDLLEDLELKEQLDGQLASVNQGEMKTLNMRIDQTKAIAALFEKAVEQYRDERRTDVEKAASDIFRQLRAKSAFDRLQINPQYGLNIITQEGEILNRAEWRSSGEEQVVALSLIGALNRCANIDAPVFMDTPFGRLDTKHGESILRFLPNLADQVVLMVTDREFRPGDERHLEGHIKGDLTIRYQGERIGSQITRTEGSA